jgi:hypothetical protein
MAGLRFGAGVTFVVVAGNNGRDSSLNARGYSISTSPGNRPFAVAINSALSGDKTDPARG